jgi:uncharacterized protein (DUF169 family)
MNQFSIVADSISKSLNLRIPPVAICLTDKVPDGIPEVAQSAAAGCVFWEWGADQAFATSLKDHRNCVVGMYTHKMPLEAKADQDNLNDCLKVFADLGYVRPEDISRIPVLEKTWQYVTYSPLKAAPLPPAAVLLFVNSEGSLIVTEAVQQLEPNSPPALGRPACAIVPQVVNSGRAALSLGCCGARAYLNVMTEDIAVWALPGDRIAEYAERIRVLSKANTILEKFHQLRRKDIAEGLHPSVSESISRLESST